MSAVPIGAGHGVAAREAAFGATPERSAAPPPGAAASRRWLAAVALGGLGRYAAAAAELERLVAEPCTPPAVAAHAAVTRASHLRQQGGHAQARAWDARGLRIAAVAGPDPARSDPDGTGSRAARVDALVGLAADAVGLGDAAAARRLLDAADRAAAGLGAWRPAVRAGWVRAELALLEGRADEARGPAAASLAAARAAGAVRHVLKSRLVLAVARGVAGEPGAVLELDAVRLAGTERGLLPIVWPAALAAADLASGDNDANGGRSDAAPGDRTSGTTRRRHAAIDALSVLYSRADPAGKRRTGEALRNLLRVTVV